MMRLRGDALCGLLLPDDVARIEIEAIDLEMMDGLGGWSLTFKVESFFRGLDLAFAYGRRDKNSITPDNRGRPPQAGNRSFPGNIIRLAPGIRQGRIVL